MVVCSGDMVKCPYRHSRGLVGVLQVQFNSHRACCNLWSTCQSMTLHTELHTSLNISEALLHTLTHCIVDSADCATTVLPPASVPLHMLLLVCLFICLP